MKVKTLFYLILLQISLAGNSQVYQLPAEQKISLEERVKQLELELAAKDQQQKNELNNLKNQVTSYAPMGMLLFLFGGVCALWAQSTGRNAWYWFFAGLFLSVVALIVVLSTNSNDIDNADN
mgnify:FL=1